MELSTSMKFVIMRAEAEANQVKVNKAAPEFLFLGILKLSELKAKDFAPTSRYIKEIEEDIETLREILSSYEVDSVKVRGLLRSMIASGTKISGEAETVTRMKMAEQYAEKRKQDKVWAQDVLSVLLAYPTNAILQVCPIQIQKVNLEEKIFENQKQPGPNLQTEEKKTEMSIDFLSQLTNQIRNMRAKLLSVVHGQDHVVHTFSEGMFAAEVLAFADEKRKRPRAVFVFVGPPGVGKTFLAEQAAQELSIPYKRFDMSSFSDHQAYIGLIGFEKSYHGAKPGTLTGFVKENPHCILLFDEIEKAHLNTIHLFLQILDAGRLADRYMDEDILFKDTIIIFTSNAGRSLYEGNMGQNAAGVSRKMLLKAIETEKNPQTGQSFFPAAITSRMATGWPLLFNHLQAYHLEKISVGELNRLCALFEKQYQIKAESDSFVSTALLFQEGGQTDARTIRAQTELFFKNEIFKVCRLFNEDHFEKILSKWKKINFIVETSKLKDNVRPLFFCDVKTEILIYGSASFAERFRSQMPGYILYDTQNVEEAMQIAGEKDIRLVLLDITEKSIEISGQNDLYGMETVYERAETAMMSAFNFDYAPMATGRLHDGNRLFRSLCERLPELPVYLLETADFEIDPELLMSFVRAGARGKLREPTNDFSIFEDELSVICRELYIQGMAARMASERKVLYFETAPKISKDQSEITIRLRDFSLKRAMDAEDAGSVLDDVEKPNIYFTDIIGAYEAKEELKFFIDFLKNPKKFSAQGLKPPKGILLYGPPGTGKTMLAKAMAGESDAAFIPTVASSFVTKYQGSGPESVRKLFQKARRYAPSILFIDEIDAIGRKRGQSNTAHGEEMALNALFTEMDGFSVDPKRPVFVLAATNFDVEEGKSGIGIIDEALVRRFDRRILVDLPNMEEREEFIRKILRKNKTHLVSENMIQRLASRAIGMSPANLASIMELASRMAIKAGIPLDDSILDEAYELTKHGAKKEWGYEYLERVARHESGHAFFCYLGGNIPSYLTIVARGGHGGYMEHSAKESKPLSTKEELIHRIRTALGGRAAEIVYYGEKNGISTGASGDLETATRIAQSMICSYGMDETFGLGVIGQREAMNDPKVKNRVNEILGMEMSYTIEMIRTNKHRIDRMVEALMRKNKLTGEEIDALLREN